MSRRFYINFLVFWFAFFTVIAAGSALAQACDATTDAAGWIASNQTFCVSYQGGCRIWQDISGVYVIAGYGQVYVGQSGGPNCTAATSRPPTSGPASNGSNGCNAGVSSGYSVPVANNAGSSVPGPMSVDMGGCVFEVSTQAGNADGSRVGGIAVSTGATAAVNINPVPDTGAAGATTATGERRVINIDGSTTVTTVKNIPDGNGGTLQQVTETTTPAGGGTPVTSTSIGSGTASPVGGGGGAGGGGGTSGGVGGLGTAGKNGTNGTNGTNANNPTPFVAPASGTFGSSSGWYTSKYPGGLHAVWDTRKAALFATPLGGAIANMAVPVGAGAEPSWTFTLWRINGTYTLALPSWIWTVMKSILLLSAAFACRRIIFGG